MTVARLDHVSTQPAIAAFEPVDFDSYAGTAGPFAILDLKRLMAYFRLSGFFNALPPQPRE